MTFVYVVLGEKFSPLNFDLCPIEMVDSEGTPVARESHKLIFNEICNGFF